MPLIPVDAIPPSNRSDKQTRLFGKPPSSIYRIWPIVSSRKKTNILYTFTLSFSTVNFFFKMWTSSNVHSAEKKSNAKLIHHQFFVEKKKKMFELFVCFWLDFGSSVRKLIGSKTSSPAAHDVSQLVNGSSATPPPRPSAASSKLSGYFQRSSSASSSALRRTNHPPLSSSLSGSSVALNGRLNQPSAPPPSVLPSDLCPSCLMPFDKNRKRRLIDSCGHERCYACLFSSELCPLCSPGSSTHVFAFLLVCLFVFGLGASWVTNTVWLEVGPAGGSGYLGSWNFENEETVSAICINSPSESFT